MRFFDRLMRPGGVSCHRVRQLVQSYLDGELHGPEVDKLAAHLHRCKRCGVEAESYRRIKAAFSAPVPEQTVDRLRRFALSVPTTEHPPDGPD